MGGNTSATLTARIFEETTTKKDIGLEARLRRVLKQKRKLATALTEVREAYDQLQNRYSELASAYLDEIRLPRETFSRLQQRIEQLSQRAAENSESAQRIPGLVSEVNSLLGQTKEEENYIRDLEAFVWQMYRAETDERVESPSNTIAQVFSGRKVLLLGLQSREGRRHLDRLNSVYGLNFEFVPIDHGREIQGALSGYDCVVYILNAGTSHKVTDAVRAHFSSENIVTVRYVGNLSIDLALLHYAKSQQAKTLEKSIA